MCPLTEQYYESKDLRLGLVIEIVKGGDSFAFREFDGTIERFKPMADKKLGMWCSSKVSLNNHPEQVAALGFYMDGLLAFIPLMFAFKSFQDSSAVSSLELALRIFTPTFVMS